MNDEASAGRRLNWRWIVLCCLGGLLLVGLALIFQSAWNWSGVTTEALVEGGIALAFVGIAFVFEQRFASTITKAASGAARATVAAETQNIQDRIQDLSDAVRALNRRDAQQQDEAISRLDEPNYENIMAALSEAEDMGALERGGWARVEATADPDVLALSFRRGTSHKGAAHVLEIIIRPLARAKVQLSTFPIVEWSPTESAALAGHKISREIIRVGLLQNADDFDWALALRNLQRFIDIAVRSWRGDADVWRLNGRLYALLGDDWAVTSIGLEHRTDPAFMVERKFFYQTTGPTGWASNLEVAHRNLISRQPAWCEPDEWDKLIRRAQEYY